MTDLASYIVSIVGSFPAGLEFLLPIFTFLLLIVGLILITVIFITFIRILRG